MIYQLFNKTENNTSFQLFEESQLADPDREFIPSEYPFEHLPEFCKELSTPLKYIKGKKGSAEFKMFNPESRRFYFGNPLFIIDGILTKDPVFLSSLNFQELDRIQLYYDNQRLSNYFGFAGFSGVVILSSKEGKLLIPEDSATQTFSVQGLQPLLNHEPQLPTDLEIPILRPQLLWDPDLSTDSKGELELSFQQSDDIGTFQIEVMVQSENGRRGIGRLNYKVSD